MRYLLKTTCSNEFIEATCDYVLANLTPEVAQRLLAMREKARPWFDDKDFGSVRVYDRDTLGCACELTTLMELPWWQEGDEDGEEIEVPDGVEVPASDFRRDCTMVHIKTHGVLWGFYEKHCDVASRFETSELSWDQVEQAAKTQEQAATPYCHICGEPFLIDDHGIANHVDADDPTCIDHDRDGDHTPYSLEEDSDAQG